VSAFQKAVKAAAPTASDLRNRRWIYVPYDRYTDRTGPLTEQSASETGIVIVESTAKALRRPYHKKKLVVLISNMRHFALEQQKKGVSVLYHLSTTSHGQALLELQRSHHLPRLTCMTPAERELRLDLSLAQQSGLAMDFVPDTTWASTTQDFLDVYGPFKPGRSYVMDRFYRHMRGKTGILMQGAQPVGGRYSFDTENRKPYRGEVPVPTPPEFPPDAITQEVIALVESTYSHHFGSSEHFNLPCTQDECDQLGRFFLARLLPYFGRYEDAMRDDQLQLFHSKTSVLVNLGRLLASDLIASAARAAAADTAPLAACEGFIRQLLGWREFMRHLHEQTDGYRRLSGHVPQQKTPRRQEQSPDQTQQGATAYGNDTHPDPFAGAAPSALHASLPLPAVYWGAPSGLQCMDTVVAQVIEEGWSHHITRLMILSNLATLCGFSPRELTDWFWFAYVDAYDWVVEPNVLGMATYADGGMTATKPYVSGAAYIHRMSNFCGHCRYDPKKATGAGSCPFTALYWTFLERNEPILGRNFRLQMPYRALHRKAGHELVQLRARAEEAIADLQRLKRPTYGAAAAPSHGEDEALPSSRS
jgi:deoxyribodipyrimidine photolyase-related protein